MPLPKYGYAETKRNQELVFNMAPEFVNASEKAKDKGTAAAAAAAAAPPPSGGCANVKNNHQRRAQVTTGKAE